MLPGFGLVGRGRRAAAPAVIGRVDESLEAYLRATVPLSAVDIDVSFEPPTEEWAAKLTRPTVSLYLWDVRRSATRSITGTETFERDGVQMRRLALPRVEMHYAVTAWTTEYEDERSLLGALMISLLAQAQLPVEYIASELADLPAPHINFARSDDTWIYSFESRMKTALQLQITTAVETGAGAPLANAVGELSVGFNNQLTGTGDAPMRRVAGECLDPAAVGANVRSPYAVATVNASGRFLINARPGDELVLETDPPQTAVVPASGGVLVGS